MTVDRDPPDGDQPRPRSRLRARLGDVGFVVLAVVVIAVIGLVVRGGIELPGGASESIEKARALQADGQWKAAQIELKNALREEPNHLEGRVMLARALLRLGDGAGALKELSRAERLGASGDELGLLRLRALSLDGRHRDLLTQLEEAGVGDASVERLRLKAGAQLALEQLEPARTSYRRVLELSPEDTEARVGLARVAFVQRDYNEALAQAGAALAGDPENSDALVIRGGIELARGAFESALETYRAAREGRTRVAAGVGQIRAYLGLGRPAEARTVLDELVAARPDVVVLRFWRGTIAEHAGNEKDAIAGYRDMLSVAPKHPETLFALARLLARSGQEEQAIELLERLIVVAPERMPGRKLLAALRLRKRDAPGAIAALKPAVDSGLADAAAIALLGNAYLRSGERDRGVELLRRASEDDPDSADIQTWLGVASLYVGAGEDAAAAFSQAVALDPDSGEAGVLLVLTHLREKRFGEALAAARAGVERAPDSPAAHNLLGAALELKGEREAARAAYRKALSLDGSFREGRLNVARMLLIDGEPAAARALYEKVLGDHPDDERALMGKAAVELALNRVDRAIAVLERARTMNPESAHPRFLLGQLYLRSARPVQALEVAGELVELRPNAVRVRLLLGAAQLAAGRPREAADTLAPVVRRRPESTSASLPLAAARLQLGEFDSAEELLRRILRREPAHPRARNLLARVLIARSRLDEAESMVADLVQDEPGSAEAHALRGDLGIARNDPGGALTAYRTAHRLQPGTRYVIAIARTLHGLGQSAQGRALLDDWIAARPDDVVALRLQGELALEANDNRAAIQAFQAVIERNPDDVAGLNNLAWLLLSVQPWRAEPLAARAHELAPRHPSVLDTYGWVLFKNGKIERAIPLLQAGVAGNPGQPAQRYHLAAALAASGERDAARAELDRALASRAPYAERAAAEALRAELE